MSKVGVLRWSATVLCLTILAGFAAVSDAHGPTENRGELIEAIEELVAVEMEKGPIPGVSVAVEHHGELLMAEGFGYADLEHDVPVHPETVFRIGSVTKQFTALSILQLVEQGKIALDDEMTRFLPDYPTQGHTVTIHHLLTHTSGIASYTGLGEKFWNVSRLDLSHEELLEIFADEPFDFAPGEKWSYNNSAYYLLGMIVEVASGESYADYIDNHIFNPLGMADTMYCDPVAIVPHRARGYSVTDGVVVNSDPLSLTSPGAAGAMCSTPLDLLRWQRALDSNSLMSAESRKLMLTEATLNDGSGTDYAYGLSLSDLDGHLNVAHGGGINGFLVALDTFPDDELVVVVFSNTDGAKSGRIADNIARTVLGIPIPEFEDLPLPEGWEDVFTGTFAVMGQEIRLFADDGKLMVEGPGGAAARLMHQGMGEFVLEADTSQVFKFAGTGGDQLDLVIVVGGQELKAERK